jgi:hypothetical protein
VILVRLHPDFIPFQSQEMTVADLQLPMHTALLNETTATTPAFNRPFIWANEQGLVGDLPEQFSRPAAHCAI